MGCGIIPSKIESDTVKESGLSIKKQIGAIDRTIINDAVINTPKIENKFRLNENINKTILELYEKTQREYKITPTQEDNQLLPLVLEKSKIN